MIAKFLVSRFAGPVVIALVAALIASFGFGGFQTYRLNNATALVEAQAATIASKDQAIDLASTMIAQRDSLIATQNEAVEALRKARAEDRVAYVKQYAAADERAKSNDERSRQLLSRTTALSDELSQARAAHALLIEELIQ